MPEYKVFVHRGFSTPELLSMAVERLVQLANNRRHSIITDLRACSNQKGLLLARALVWSCECQCTHLTRRYEPVRHPYLKWQSTASVHVA